HWVKEDKHNHWVKELEKKTSRFDYSNIDTLALFEGTHPVVMKELVDNEDWIFNIDIRKKNFKNIKHRLLYFIWKKTGLRPFEYSNYKKI
ncbi:MAG: glycosyltransferase family 2 protein, partial [Bacteroidia bacterium]|nr:glycosyltransferase family 2 protein [Bacteroidia bacterium]